jgi:hypothetical protein
LRALQPFFDNIPHYLDFERQPRDDTLLALAIALKMLEPHQAAGLKARITIAPQPDGVGVDAVFSCELSRRHSSIRLF